MDIIKINMENTKTLESRKQIKNIYFVPEKDYVIVEYPIMDTVLIKLLQSEMTIQQSDDEIDKEYCKPEYKLELNKISTIYGEYKIDTFKSGNNSVFKISKLKSA